MISWIQDRIRRNKHHSSSSRCPDELKEDINALFSREAEDWLQHRPFRQGADRLVSSSEPCVDNNLFGISFSGGGMRSGVYALGVTQALVDGGFMEAADYVSSVSGGGYPLIGAYSYASEASACATSADGAAHERSRRIGFGRHTHPFRTIEPENDDSERNRYVDNPTETSATYKARKRANLLSSRFSLLDTESWAAAGYYIFKTAALWFLYFLPIVAIVALIALFAPGRVEEQLELTVNELDTEQRTTLISSILEDGLLPDRIPGISSGTNLDVRGTEFDVRGLVVEGGTPFEQLTRRQRTALVSKIQTGSPDASQVTVQLSSVTHNTWDRAAPFDDFGQKRLTWWLMVIGIIGVGGSLIFAWIAGGSTITLLKRIPGSDVEGSGWKKVIVRHSTCLLKFFNAVILVVIIAYSVVLLMWGLEWLFAPEEHRSDGASTGISNLWAGLIGAGWIGSILSTIKGFQGSSSDSDSSTGSKLINELALTLGGYLFLLLVIGTVFELVWWGAGRTSWDFNDPQEPLFLWPSLVVMLGLLIVGAVWGTNAGDYRKGLLNRLSLLGIYSRRLRRTWMSDKIDIPVSKLADPEFACLQRRTPYPLFNAGMTIAGKTGPETLDRKGEPFLISPYFSGSRITGWFETKKRFPNMTLSEASAISGSAFSPNTGQQQKPYYGPVLALLNGRLGRWIPHPHGVYSKTDFNAKARPDGTYPPLEGRKARFWRRSVKWILFWREVFGNARHSDPFVFVADGGHFENSGVYELLRRKCKFIIYVDQSGDDPRPARQKFGGLAHLVRMARIDMGVDIEVDLGPLMRMEDKNDPAEFEKSKQQVVCGRLIYGNDDGTKDEGEFLYIKGVLPIEPWPADIIHYVNAKNPVFPNDSTADLQYDQPQFEAYRKLGLMAGQEAIKHMKGGMRPDPSGNKLGTDDLFSAQQRIESCRDRWEPVVRRAEDLLSPESSTDLTELNGMPDEGQPGLNEQENQST